MQHNFSNKNNGFTLVEALVAVSIFTVSVLSLMVVLSDSVANTAYAKKKIIATYLAQEGIEYIRNVRDTYVLYQSSSSDGWNDFKVKLSPCDTELLSVCYFDDQNLNFTSQIKPITTIDVFACANNDCPYLLYDEGLGRYNYATGSITDLVRKIRITNTNNDEMRVVSTVSWTQGSGTYEITLSANLFNWTQ